MLITMTIGARMVEAGTVVRLGTRHAPLQFVEGQKAPDGGLGRRYLTLGSQPAFELSFWCGTCPFLFERMESANRTLSSSELTDRLNRGLERIDRDILDVAGELLPECDYLPILVEVYPRLVTPMLSGDYFAEEQVKTWGVNGFWGLPEFPRTPYYRTGSRRLDARAHLYEFVVPMVPPSWNDPTRVASHANALRASSAPSGMTCLAVSIVDICQPATARPDEPEHYGAHWCWANFLLDGHHKAQAAAESGRSLRLLTLLSLDHSLATRQELLTMPSKLRG